MLNVARNSLIPQETFKCTRTLVQYFEHEKIAAVMLLLKRSSLHLLVALLVA